MADQTKTKEALERLKGLVADFENSDDYKAFLRWQARFHKYSWRNALLIKWQMPTASYVKGFKGWLDLGRVVKKGEKGIMILKPLPFKKTVTLKDGSEEERKGIYFGATYVFDVSQTDPIAGHPNPFDPSKGSLPEITDERGGDLYAALERHLASEGCAISIYDPTEHRADGWYRPATKEIGIAEGARLKMLATLIHEAAHHHARDAEETFGYGTEEVIVESVAYIVADHFGLDTGVSSVPYVHTWLRRDPKGFEKGLGEIQRLAARLIDVLEAELVTTEPKADVAPCLAAG